MADTPIRVAILQDWDTDNEAEQRQFVRSIERLTERSVEMVWAGILKELADASNADALIVDYGGLAGSFSDTLSRHGKAVRAYAEDHPGTLVVLWTAFTARAYAATFEDEFSHHAYEHNADDPGHCYARVAGSICDKRPSDRLHREAGASSPANVLLRYSDLWGPERADFREQMRAWLA